LRPLGLAERGEQANPPSEQHSAREDDREELFAASGHTPSPFDAALHAEHGEARQVGRSGEQLEVGIDLERATDPGSSCAMFAAHEVGQLALHLGARGPVVGAPGGIALTGAGPGERLFMGADADGAPAGGFGELSAQGGTWNRRL
jgi:hypothetical protein